MLFRKHSFTHLYLQNMQLHPVGKESCIVKKKVFSQNQVVEVQVATRPVCIPIEGSLFCLRLNLLHCEIILCDSQIVVRMKKDEKALGTITC